MQALRVAGFDARARRFASARRRRVPCGHKFGTEALAWVCGLLLLCTACRGGPWLPGYASPSAGTSPAQGASRRDLLSWCSQALAVGAGAASPGSAAAADAGQPAPLKVAGSAAPMPAIGFGTCCRKGSKGPVLIEAAKSYLASGGRLIDTAQLYENHKDLAVAIRESGVPRDQLWVTSKVLVTDVKPKEVVQSVQKSLDELGLEYLDLMLLHGGEGWGISPKRDVSFWRGLVDAKSKGLVRSIGVSNHNQQEIERLVTETGVKPAVNQIEFHPWVPAETKGLVKWCQGNDIAVTAYGSLGGTLNKAAGDAVEEVAKRRGVSKAQVLLRWGLNQGVAVIPGSNSAQHIKENLDLASIKLDAQDARDLEDSEKPAAFRRWHSCRSGCAD